MMSILRKLLNGKEIEMSSEEKYRRPEILEAGLQVRTIIGSVMIIVGIILVLWVGINIYKIYTNPREIEVFKQIIPDSPELREMEIDGKKVILPAGLFHFLSYSAGCFILFIGGVIGGGLITAGVNLLQLNLQRLERRMGRKIDDLKDELNKMRKILENKDKGPSGEK